MVSASDNGTVKPHRALLIFAVLLSVLGCGGTGLPPASAGEMGDVVSALVRRGATITDQVAGDAGCSESSLHSNAVRLDVRLPGETASSSVYLFRWKTGSDFDNAADAFARCVAERNDQPQTASHSPWRAYGSGWSDALSTAVNEALAETVSG